MRREVCLLSLLLIVPAMGLGQTGQDRVSLPEGLVVDGAPVVPNSLVEASHRYTDYRAARFQDWSPERREMLIATRFGDTEQIHLVTAPGGARRQLTFFPDAVGNAMFHPNGGDYFIFLKDVGGGEWYQIYRYTFATGESVLLTDGKSRNLLGAWSTGGNWIAYSSTRRNGKDDDLWIMNPSQAGSDRLLTQVEGGGWDAVDWSPDDKFVLAREEISIGESHLWLVDVASGQKTEVTPEGHDQIFYGHARFSPDGRGIYVITDRGSEFLRLAYLDLSTKQETVLTEGLHWDVDQFDLTRDGSRIAFVTNEEGVGSLHVRDIRAGRDLAAPELPPGTISGLGWHRNGRDLGFSLTTARSPQDCYSFDVETGRLERWTASETAVRTDSFPEAQLIRWRSFDGRQISGFLYLPPGRFTGKRPVLVVIHGGPESQSRPSFLARNNYFVNELGIALIYPNVRGSTGFGKAFTRLDNGFRREDSYRDVGALFDWIRGRPDLDAERIAITGGSYGGHMTLAIATFFSDRIRCSIDVVGMSNLVTFLEHTEEYRRNLRRIEYGDERDAKMRSFLERIAPMNNIDKIRKPILVIAGRNDPRVPVTESDQIANALKKQATPVWYLMAKDEGHGFRKKSNQDYQFYVTVAFLERFLIGD